MTLEELTQSFDNFKIHGDLGKQIDLKLVPWNDPTHLTTLGKVKIKMTYDDGGRTYSDPDMQCRSGVSISFDERMPAHMVPNCIRQGILACLRSQVYKSCTYKGETID